MSKARGLRPGVVGKLESRMTADGEREQSGSVSESGSKRRVMGFGQEKPGSVAVLATLCIEV